MLLYMEISFQKENLKLLVVQNFDYLNRSSCRELNALQDGWSKIVLELKSRKLSIVKNPFFPVSRRHFELFRKMIPELTKLSSKGNVGYVFEKSIKF